MMSKSGGPYNEAARLLTPLLTNQKSKSLKTLAFGGNSKGRSSVSKSAYATVCKTLECKALIDEILSHTTSDSTSNKISSFKSLIICKGSNSSSSGSDDGIKDHGLAYVLLYELLFGKYKCIRGGGRAKKIIMRYETELRQVHREVILSYDHLDEDGFIKKRKAFPFPRYARINTLRVKDLGSVIASLQKELGSFYADEHVPNLLVFPPGTDLHAHSLVKEGGLVLQDKSSCFSALALARGSADFLSNITGDLLDACAAPGNKTTHLACLSSENLRVGGKVERVDITALDRDSSRIKILKSRAELLAPNDADDSVIIKPLHADFLTIQPDDARFKNLRGILLDPSCSGSGIVSQPDRIANTFDETRRIKSLSNFQITVLKHAMSFPQVERIVYSTCSIHDQENEHVVATCLQETAKGNNSCEWKLVAPFSLRHWKRRGKAVSGLSPQNAKCLVRCDAFQGDETNGFFVAYFKRTSSCAESIESLCDSKKIPTLADYGVDQYTNQFELSSKTIPEKRNLSKAKKISTDERKQRDVSLKPSKKTKKLLWKKRQAAQKAERLKKVKLMSTSGEYKVRE